MLTPSGWTRLLLSLAAVFALFQWSAEALGSDRGQRGLIVAFVVVATTLAVERVVFGRRIRVAVGALGLGVPRAPSLVVAGAITLALLAVVPFFTYLTGIRATPWPGWAGLVPGLFAQGGVAEETLFRGLLFGRVREGRSFWRAATLSSLPFVAVHLYLFLTMTWPVALAAVLLALVLSFPLAHVYELGGRTIWAGALLHFVIQSTPKLLVFPDTFQTQFALLWILAAGLVPQLAWLVRRPLADGRTGLQNG